MGQFGPTVAGNKGIRRFADSGIYLLGVLVSSTIFGVLLDTLVGSYSRSTLGARGALGATLALVCALLTLDTLRLWGSRSTSFGLNRQTPYGWRLRGAIGILGWGLDTGLPVSTIRVTPLPLLGVVLVAAGYGGPLHGLAYGLGIALGLGARLIPGRIPARIAESMDDLARQHHNLRPVRLILVPSGVTACLLLACWSVLPAVAK